MVEITRILDPWENCSSTDFVLDENKKIKFPPECKFLKVTFWNQWNTLFW